MTDDNLLPFAFPSVARKKVTADFDGGRLTSDGGVMLLSMAERRLGVAERLARCFPDRRDPARIIVSAVYRPYRWNFRNSLQSIATRHCKSLAQSFARDWFGARMRDQAPGAGGEDSKVHGISSSIRDCGWPSAIASRVAFIQV